MATIIGTPTESVADFDDTLSKDERMYLRLDYETPNLSTIAERLMVQSRFVIERDDGQPDRVVPSEWTHISDIVTAAAITQAEYDALRPILKKIRDYIASQL